MDNGTGPTVFPLHRCKTLHLVRHAQGIHNVEGDKNYKAYMSPEFFDAHLTQLGWQQVDNLRKHVHACGLSKRIGLVITSPLLRTLQTAVGVFGGEGYTDRMDALPLMLANAGQSKRSAISSLDCPPIIAVELCREHLGVHPCDRRRSISEYQFMFPAIDFSLIESDEDVLWKANVRETKEEVAKRGRKFMKWLWTRKEEEIAIVTHSGFLFHTLSAFGNDCNPLVKKEICKHFSNCELRSMVIVDRSMIGADSSTTNYPGKIPCGPLIPSACLDNNLKEQVQPGQVRAFGMLAGGTGITPMFQVTRAILENPKDKTKINLIYANVTYEDILLKEELDTFVHDFPDRFSVSYVLNQPPEGWNGGVGFVTKEMIQTHCPAPASDIKILRCGPPPMNKAMAAHLESLGYTSEMQFQF